MWQTRPFKIEAKAGQTLAFCRCNRSKNGPYCDGSHAGSGISPYVVKFDQDKAISACGCQQSKNRPYCDGSHSKIIPA